MIGSLGVGGAELQLVEVCRRLDGRRWRPRVATLGPAGPLGEPLRREGIEVRELRPRARARGPHDWRRGVTMARSGMALRRLLAEPRRRVVHAYLHEATVVAAVALSGDAVTPFVLAKRSLVRSIADGPLYFPLARYANSRADVIHINSRAVGREIVEKEGAPPEKLRLVYNGVDTLRFRPLEASRGGPRTRIGMLANLIPYKGHREALEAVAALRQDFPAVELWVWGRDGPSGASVAELCRSLGLADRVRLLGIAQDPAEALRQMDVFVSASHEEGFSNSILEAMATGLPVVATAVGGTVEQIRHDESGLLIPPGDPRALAEALRAVLTDEALASRLGSAARRRSVERFSVERMVLEMAALYEELAVRP